MLDHANQFVTMKHQYLPTYVGDVQELGVRFGSHGVGSSSMVVRLSPWEVVFFRSHGWLVV